MELLKNTSEDKFVLVMLSEKQYEKKLEELVRNAESNNAKICYVCLSKPVDDVIASLKNLKISIGKFFFIDILSSHYKSRESMENCIFIGEGTHKLGLIKNAIGRAISEKGCGMVIFDTISSLLVYEQTHDIVRFTHDLTTEEKQQNINNVFIILKEGGEMQGYCNSLIGDLKMFADKSIDFVDD